MPRKPFVCAVVVLFCLTHARQTYAQVTRVDDRLQAVTSLIKAMEQVAAKSGNPEAKKFADTLKKNHQILAPINIGSQGDGIVMQMLNVAADSRTAVPISIVLKEDAQVSPMWKELLSRNIVAFHLFNPDRLVFLFDRLKSLSTTYLGLVGLQQLYAFHHPLSEDSSGHATQIHRKANLFEYSLLQAIGGKPYRKILDNEVARIAKATTKAGKVPNMPMYYYPELDTIFGKKAQSKLEKGAYFELLYQHALYVYEASRQKPKTSEKKR